MKSRDFCYWLQGFFELQGSSEYAAEGLTTEQVKIIKAHLGLVFKHEIDPSMPDPTGILQEMHDAGKVKPDYTHTKLRC